MLAARGQQERSEQMMCYINILRKTSMHLLHVSNDETLQIPQMIMFQEVT